MANLGEDSPAMKWFKHISDSLDDPTIFHLMKEFKGDGYLVFFGIIEIYAREFQTKNDWILTEKLSFFRHKLLISQSKLKKILSKITTWQVSFTDDTVSIFIPKFKELMDESTIKKLREHEESFRKRSGIVPKSAATDEDEDKEEDKDKEEKKEKERKEKSKASLTGERQKKQINQKIELITFRLLNGSFCKLQDRTLEKLSEEFPCLDMHAALSEIALIFNNNPALRVDDREIGLTIRQYLQDMEKNR